MSFAAGWPAEEELGVEPSSDASDLETHILRGEQPRLPVRRLSGGPSPRALEGLAFVGREDELEIAVEALLGFPSVTVLVVGAAGVGKSRLLAEVAARLALPVLSVRGFLPERDEPWALARSLLGEALSLDLAAARALPDRAASALVDLLPELEDLRPIQSWPVDHESRRALALEGGVRLVATVASRGVLILVDDLQWADATSLALLGLVERRVPEAGLVLAYRPEEVHPESPAGAFLRELRNGEVAIAEVPLGALSVEVVSRLVVDDDLALALAEATDRTPLALTEVIGELARRGAIALDPQGRWRSRTEGVTELAKEIARAGQRRVARARFDRQPPDRKETLALLALIGREAPARFLAEARATEQKHILADLDALARSGLVRLGDGGWTLVHDLVGETIAAALDREERGRLHQLLARALETEGGDSAELARHLAAAGDRVAAAASYGEAARQRLARFAGDEAWALADAGLALAPEPAVRLALIDSRAQARALRGDLPGACEDVRAELAMTEAGPRRAQLLARLALNTPAIDNYDKASEIAEAAIIEARTDEAARAEALAVAAMLDVNSNRMERAEVRAAETLALFERLGDSRGVASALDARAMSVLYQGRLPEAAQLLDRVSRLYRDSGQLLKVATPQVTRAVTLAIMGRLDEAARDAEEAVELERSLGQREGEAGALGLQSMVLSALGRVRDAREAAELALAMNRELGQREGTAESWVALSLAHEAAGDREGAQAAAEQALELATDMPLVASRAAGQLASLSMARGDLASAEGYATRCLAQGVPLWSYEGHLVLAEVALARREPDAETRAARALAAATEGGWLLSSARRRLEGLVAEAARMAPIMVRKRARRTFMFTDIVGSTGLVEMLGDEAWDDLLRWHDETLRSLFAAYGGEEVNRLGDGFFVAFDRAAAAVKCGVEIQRSLAQHRREHGFSPPVRIGLHEAVATVQEGDYQGKGVHMAARLGALAQGGEILASRTVIEHLEDVKVADSRRVKLRGFSEPIQVEAIDWV